MYTRTGEQMQLTSSDHDSCKRGLLFDGTHNRTITVKRRDKGYFSFIFIACFACFSDALVLSSNKRQNDLKAREYSSCRFFM